MSLIHQLIDDESGATAIEYGLIAGLIAVAVIAALTTLGDSLEGLFNSISDTIVDSTGSSS